MGSEKVRQDALRVALGRRVQGFVGFRVQGFGVWGSRCYG